MADKGQDKVSEPGILNELRVRRLVVVDDDDREMARLQVDQGVVELSLGGGDSGLPFMVVVHAGEPEDGSFAAGIELWSDGDSVGGCELTGSGTVRLHRFGGPAS